jgi:Ca-activated chloride channel family protein
MRKVRALLGTLLAGTLILSLLSCAKQKKAGPALERRQFEEAQIHSNGVVGKLQYPESDQFNTEEYGRISENEFLDSRTNPLSTFSIDVDTASYSNVRRFISEGKLPPAAAVRIEELINYFKYDYPQPEGDQPFSINTEVATCPWDAEHRLVQIGLQARRVSLEDAPPNNLVFLIDTSGSMDFPDKLPLLKSAFKLLADQMREQDRVAMVAYAGSAGLVLPSTPGSKKNEITAAITKLEAGGSTAGGEGIKLAYEVARDNFIQSGNNRVILATDGDFNVGVSSDGELQRLIEKERDSGVFLTVLGFGTGNIKDSKMELLADKGNGNYAYVDNINEARKVLVNELGGTLITVAKDVKIQVEFNPAKVQAYRLIGYENRLMRAEEFNDDRKDAGELGSGHSVTALYEVVLPGSKTRVATADPLKYQSSEVKPEASSGNELLTVKLRYKQPQGENSLLETRTVDDATVSIDGASDNLRFAAAVAQFGMLLRESKFKGHFSFEDCIALARGASKIDPEGYRGEFIALAERGAQLSSSKRIDGDGR